MLKRRLILVFWLAVMVTMTVGCGWKAKYDWIENRERDNHLTLPARPD